MLSWNKNSFWVNYKNTIGTYLSLGIPIGSTIYIIIESLKPNQFTGLFENSMLFTVSILTLILLMSIRLSVMLTKRKYIKKFKMLKSASDSLMHCRKRLKSEYISYLFGVFFTTFMSFMTVLLFKVIFLGNQTELIITGYNGTLGALISLIGEFFIGTWFIALTVLVLIVMGEAALSTFGVYEEFKK